ncbi:MAG TPA: PAS domain S-box protein, partial [Candidatus Sulfotelmatobacter sp.]|nr:PAS domain S-box protein [Candidatus Sulfotelmatobacter sp.]
MFGQLSQQADKALGASEERYRTLIQKLQAAVVVHGPDTRIVVCNPVAQALLGLTEDQLLGKTAVDPVWKFFREDGTVMPLEEYPVNQVIARRQPVKNLVVGVHRPGAPRNIWAVVNADPVFDNEHNLVETIVTFIDITERKQAEEELRESQERLQMIVRSEPECVKIVSSDGTLLEMNPAGLAMIETESAASVIGKPIISIIHPEDRQAWMRFHASVVQGSSGTLRFRILGLRGTPRWLESHSVPLHDRYGTTVSVLSVTRDITERKRAEEERLANLQFFASMDQVNRVIQGASDLEQMLRGVLETTLSIFDCDRSWLLYPCDPEAPSFRVPMEITKSEYPGANALNLDVPMTPNQAQNMREALASEVPVTYIAGTERPISTAKQFGVQSQMFICLYPKGSKPWVFGMHQCSSPRVWTSEEQRLFQGVGRRLADGLTSLLAQDEIRQINAELEQRVQQRTAQLHEANANLQTFAYSAAHDLRSPLRSIKGFSDIALAK